MDANILLLCGGIFHLMSHQYRQLKRATTYILLFHRHLEWNRELSTNSRGRSYFCAVQTYRDQRLYGCENCLTMLHRQKRTKFLLINEMLHYRHHSSKITHECNQFSPIYSTLMRQQFKFVSIFFDNNATMGISFTTDDLSPSRRCHRWLKLLLRAPYHQTEDQSPSLDEMSPTSVIKINTL